MKYGSVCSGIEAASVAWHDLGWSASWLAEIEKFPSTVLNYRYPDIANLGDMTTIAERIKAGEVEAPEILVGGTPCQSFSVAGARQGLNDGRGQLTISFMELANAIDERRISEGKQPCIIVWENVPGVLSDKTNAFGCFLGGLAGEECELQPSGKRWSNAGCVFGHQRKIAWRILDAQHFGVAQRRRRVFVIASARENFNPSEVLFEFKSVSGDSQTSLSSRKNIAKCLTRGVDQRLDFETDIFVTKGLYTPSSFAQYTEGVGTLKKSGGDLGGGSESLVLEPIACSTKQQSLNCSEGLANTLGKDDYKEPQAVLTYGIQANTIDRQPQNGGNGLGFAEEISPTLTKTDRHAVAAFQQNTRDEVRYIGGDGQIVGALAANAGMKQTNYIHEQVAFGIGESPDTAHCLRSGASKADKHESTTYVTEYSPNVCGTLNHSAAGVNRPAGQGNELDFCVTTKSQVRRLTPIECERLQGFPDGYTNIPYSGKPDSPDTKRYQALGNSMAVPVMKWLGQRIEEHLKC